MNKDAVLEVLDVQGKEVLLKQSLSAGIRNHVNLEFLPIGFYLVRIYNEDGASVKKVFVAK
ncbi:MAG: T9SS type A sorting domain-containing protein [Bacteroidetes bacterium]|nr:T9SS type A sorting domain-containing protein [Bacteroidota bacterium]